MDSKPVAKLANGFYWTNKYYIEMKRNKQIIINVTKINACMKLDTIFGICIRMRKVERDLSMESNEINKRKPNEQ